MIKVPSVFIGCGLMMLLVVQAQSTPLKMVDCLQGADNAKCVLPTQSGTIGSGVVVGQGGSNDAITGGFVQGNKLIASVNLGNTGALISFDLITGDRELISGILNPNETRGTALRYAATLGSREITPAYQLTQLKDVKLLPNNNYLAVMRSGFDRMELIEIDATTGDRKLFWASNFASDNHPSGLRDKEQLDSKTLCPKRGENQRNANPTAYTLAIDAFGHVYLQFNDNPQGIGYGFIRIKNGQCQEFSTYDLNLNDEIGSGYKTPREEINHMITEGNILYSVSSFADTGHLLAINLETGARQLISHKDAIAARSKGKGNVGIGTLGIARNTDGFWTIKEIGRDFKLIRVDANSGDRSLIQAKSGPLSKGLLSNTQKVFAIPNSHLLLISMNAALMIFDPKTGNSNMLSY